HLVFNLLWMVAFGSQVARRVGDWRFLAFSGLCGVAGALTHLAFHFGQMTPVVGASAARSGEIAAACRFFFAAPLGYGTVLSRAPLESLSKPITDRRMLAVLGLWVALNLIFGLGAVSIAGSEGNIAWEAHIGGFVFGLLCFGFFDTGGDQPVPLHS